MRIRKLFAINISLAFIVAAIVLVLYSCGLLKRLENAGLDLAFNLRGNISVNPRIVIVEITDKDITQVGRWPWKRNWHAAITQALSGLGVKSIYFDIIFSEPSDAQDDLVFEESLKHNKNVYLPFAFQAGDINIDRAFLPIKRFSTYIKGTGATNISPDPDGIIRRIPLIFYSGNNIYEHIALKIALDYEDLTLQEITPTYLRVANSRQQIIIPLEEKKSLLLNWPGRWENTFKHYSFLQVLSIYKDYLDGKLPTKELQDFKDSVCLIGLTAIGLYDIKPIPLQPEYPGLGVVATTINELINRKFVFTPAPLINALIFLFLCFLPAFLIFGEKPLREIIVIILSISAYFVVNLVLFKLGIWLNLGLQLFGLVLSALIIGLYNFMRVSIERQSFYKMAVTDGLTGLFNIKYFEMLLETEMMLASQDETKKFAIIMLDIDNFKKFNDTYGHQIGDLVLKEVAYVLKSTARTSDIVARYGGEEMIILLRGVNLRNALMVADKFRKNVESHHIAKEGLGTYQVTASLGVSLFRRNDSVDSLIKRADEGLYKSKENGRNRVSTLEELG